jgi:A/G-specific adenine glycosylase
LLGEVHWRSMNTEAIERFRERVWEFYRDHGRDLPWRREVTPYGVFVSEIMLQQTQVARVLARWGRWLKRFPDFEALAAASVAEVLAEWQGMGYNRRALWLKAAAGMVMGEFGGELPQDPEVLVRLPGVGPNTAESVAAFAYGWPSVFVETNIRRVFIHHFGELAPLLLAPEHPASVRRTPSVSSGEAVAEPAPGSQQGVPAPLPASYPERVISDAQLRPLIEAALDRESPREWYWALMDYGADLAKRVPNPNRRSKHYNVQSKFEGSVRQLRGEVLRRLLAGPKTMVELGMEDERLPMVLAALVKEGFVTREGQMYVLGSTPTAEDAQ